MAWNQPGDDKKRPAPRGAPEPSSLDEVIRRWQQRVQRLWRPGHGAGTAAIGLLLLALAVWLASGYYQIDPTERGVLQRLGQYELTLQPGHGWHWPWPLETLTKLNVTGNQTLDAKSSMLSSDQNLVAISWSVQYRISDPQRYLFALADPQATLQQLTESALRQQVADSAVLGLLNGDARARVITQARDHIEQALVQLDAGMTVSSVTLTDVQLPEPVLAAQRDAEKARDEHQRALSDAETYSNDILPKAQSAAQRQLADAQVYATQTVAAAQGEAERFNQLVTAYTAAPDVVRHRLYTETMESVLSHSRKIVLDVKSGSGNMIYLPLDKLVDAVRASNAAAPAAASVPAPAVAPTPAPAASTPASEPAASAEPDDRGRDRGER